MNRAIVRTTAVRNKRIIHPQNNPRLRRLHPARAFLTMLDESMSECEGACPDYPEESASEGNSENGCPIYEEDEELQEYE